MSANEPIDLRPIKKPRDAKNSTVSDQNIEDEQRDVVATTANETSGTISPPRSAAN